MAGSASPNRVARVVSVLLAGLFVSAAALLLSPGACGPAHGTRRPLVVVGVDGLEWRLVLQFAQEDALPNLTRLMNEGYAGKLETLEPTLSPVIWTTIATGKSPQRHGITNFFYKDESGEKHLFTSLHRQSKAFWNLLSDAGETCHVDGWWCTWPVEPIEGGGSMVAQTTTRAQIDFRSGRVWKGTYLKDLPCQVFPDEVGPRMDAHFDALAAKADETLAATFGRACHPPPPPDRSPPDRSSPDRSPMVEQLFGCVTQAFFADRLFLDAAGDVLDAKRPYDLLAVYLGVTDVASHLFWRDFEPQLYKHPPGADELADFGHVVRDSYRFVDAALGELRAKAPDADFILLSDHGFHGVDFERDFEASFAAKEKRFDSGHHTDAPPGVFIACGPSFKRWPVVVGTDPTLLRTVGRVEDVLPTLLVLKDLPYGDDMAGRPMRQLFTEEVLADHPIRSVPTCEDASWKREREDVRKNALRFEKNFEASLKVLTADELEKLRRLGYIVGDPPPAGTQPDDPPPDARPPDDPVKKGDGK